ncbi:MAG: hypothetical protein GX589_08445 [Deltaproteobacteria bacterium]|nr:hypothetical protein [Deltaproteobacteria bacterium]
MIKPNVQDASAARLAARLNFCFWLAVGIAGFVVLSGQVRLWETLFPARRYVLIAAALFCAGCLVWGRFKLSIFAIRPAPFVALLLFLFVSDWLCRPNALFQGPSIRGEILLGALLTLWLLWRLRSQFSLQGLPPGKLWKLLPVLLLVSAVMLLLWIFLSASGGEPIFGDDHSVFFYRLAMLKENFPYVPYYNPYWNAGLDERVIATGALGMFLFYSPLIYLLGVQQTYTWLVGCTALCLPPLSCYLAARSARLSSGAAAIAALLALACGLVWYRWAFVYGTMGFVFSTALLPLGLVLACNLLVPGCALTRRGVLLSAGVLTLVWLWPLSILAFLPAAVGTLPVTRMLFKKKNFLLFVFTLFCLNLPWASVFWSANEPLRFVQGETESKSAEAVEELPLREGEQSAPAKRWRHRQGGLDAARALKLLREKAHSANPLILCLALPGIFLLARPLRFYWLATSLWLLGVGAFGVPLKPQLELDRLLVMLMMISCVPAGAALHAVFSGALTKQARWPTLVGAALCGGFLFSGPLAVGALMGNRTGERIRFMEPIFYELAAALKKHHQGGRVLFSGCIVHEVGGGHIAPLVSYSGVPLVASSPMHTLWWYTEVRPEEYRGGGDAQTLKYFDLLNVGAVVAHERSWRKYFKERPHLFEQVWSLDSFTLFRRRDFESSYFLEGSGEILDQDFRSFTLKLDTSQALIKFKYYPFLTSTACRLSERAISKNVRFIELADCPLNTPIRIEALPPWRRALMVK